MTSVPATIGSPTVDTDVASRWRAAAVGAALVAVALTAVSFRGPSPSVGDWVRAGLIACWDGAALALARHGSARLAAVVGVAALAGGTCAATAGSADLDRLHMLAAALLPAVALHVELSLPDGSLRRPARRNVVTAGYVVALAVGAALAAAGRDPAAGVVAAAVGATVLAGLPAAHQTYARSTGATRLHLQLLGCAVAVAVDIALVATALHVLVDWPVRAAEVVAAATGLIPIALAAGTRPRISRRVDRVLVHTVSVTGLIAVVVAVYLTIVIGLGRVPAENERTLLLLSMAAAAVASMAYVPARDRLAETANRLVYGERHPPDEVLRTWGSRLSRSIPMEELLLQLAESLRKVLVLRRAEVWTSTGSRLELAVAVPDRRAPALVLGAEERPVVTRAGVTGSAWAEVWLPALLEGRAGAQLRIAPAAHSGELLGLLVIERDPDGDHFTEEDDRVLAELARQVGLALHNVQLDSALQESLENLERANEDLRASRARIVATGDAERRKIERNLHDGAQQHLVALAVNLRLAKDILAEDPEAAAEMLAALGDAVKETIQELRDLAHGIYPPLLMDSGLAEALRAAANRSPLGVSVEVEGVGRYSSEIEAAVYFCCLEALQNAAKHAPDAQVQLTVQADAAELRFTVHDDGPGFDAAVAMAGHGFVNMNDRVGAIGGSVRWESSPGAGATVSGTIPLAAEAA